MPETVAEWKALADGLLTVQPCAFHRNIEISSRYAWLYKFLPAYFKWAGMAAFASHHVRIALFPFRLDTDRTGYVDIPSSLNRAKALLLSDVNTIRETNNAIFDDIFWAHLASTTAGVGSRRASCPASGGSTRTRAWPKPVCTGSSTKRATMRRTPASYRVDRLSMARKWSSNAWASAATPRRIRAPRGSTTVRPASSPLCTTVSRVGS